MVAPSRCFATLLPSRRAARFRRTGEANRLVESVDFLTHLIRGSMGASTIAADRGSKTISQATGASPSGRPCERRDPYGAESRFRHWSRSLFLLLRPGVMGPCVRRDDSRRVRARSRPHQRTAQFSHMRQLCRERGCSPPQDAQQPYLFLPSIGVIASFASSMPSMQLTLSATTSVPSGLLPRANTSTPQSIQS